MTRPIIDLCLAVERRLGSQGANWWRKQVGLDFEGMHMAAQEAEHTEGEEETDRTVTDMD